MNAHSKSEMLAAERAFMAGLEGIREARRMGLSARFRLREALRRALPHLMKCGEGRSESVRSLLRSHALRGS
jgi:hypothetical protein